jgi:hypothetical protein
MKRIVDDLPRDVLDCLQMLIWYTAASSKEFVHKLHIMKEISPLPLGTKNNQWSSKKVIVSNNTLDGFSLVTLKPVRVRWQ